MIRVVRIPESSECFEAAAGMSCPGYVDRRIVTLASQLSESTTLAFAWPATFDFRITPKKSFHAIPQILALVRHHPLWVASHISVAIWSGALVVFDDGNRRAWPDFVRTEKTPVAARCRSLHGFSPWRCRTG